MNPRNTTSSFSKREKMRRNPFNRRNNRSISLRRLVHLAVVLPGFDPRSQRRHHWLIPQRQCQLPGLVTLVRAVHD